MDDMLLVSSRVEREVTADGLGAMKLDAELWEDGVLPLVFDSDVTDVERRMIFDACHEWESVARVQCREGPYKGRKIDVTKHQSWGCFAIWGMGTSFVFLKRWINLGQGCWKRKTLIHELGHSFGLIHEHQRPDRDSYVSILSDNIESGFLWMQSKVNFDYQDAKLHSPYDFYSIMHYPRKAFSKNGNDTIVPKSGYEDFIDVMGKVDKISESDASAISEMYGKR